MKKYFCILITLHLIFLGYEVYAVSYDYSFTPECLAKPLSSQYNGGIVVNSEFNEGLDGWTILGDAKIKHAESTDGNKYIVASQRQHPFNGLLQRFQLEKNKLYSFSAWLQVSQENADIAAIIKTPNGGYQQIGWVNARIGCWSMLKGGFVANDSGPAFFYFESKNANIEIWADSVSLQPFAQEEWQSHHKEAVELTRKRKVRLQIKDRQGRPVRNSTVSIKQTRSNFPFGSATNNNLLNNQGYQNWFFPRFKHSVFENELKWYSTEQTQGKEDYSTSDALVNLLKSRGVAIRGHNVFWDDPSYQLQWVKGLQGKDLSAAVDRRINSVVSQYRGQLIHWDVLNENLHFNFFESRLGENIGSKFYETAHNIDGQATPFLNDYNTIEDNRDPTASPGKYLEKIAQIRREGYNGPLGIGVQGHFSIPPNFAYIRSALDQLASAKLPIWITELDVKTGSNEANYLDQILRELHSHQAVQGIIMWTGWRSEGCGFCLTDNNFKNLPTGDVVDKFRTQVLRHGQEFSITTDSDGYIEVSLFHGEYEAKIDRSEGAEVSKLHKFVVSSKKK